MRTSEVLGADDLKSVENITKNLGDLETEMLVMNPFAVYHLERIEICVQMM